MLDKRLLRKIDLYYKISKIGKPDTFTIKYANLSDLKSKLFAALKQNISPKIGLASVPTAVQQVAKDLDLEKDRKTIFSSLLELHRDGSIELRGDAGVGRLTAEELANSPPGPLGLKLIWARILRDTLVDEPISIDTDARDIMPVIRKIENNSDTRLKAIVDRLKEISLENKRSFHKLKEEDSIYNSYLDEIRELIGQDWKNDEIIDYMKYRPAIARKSLSIDMAINMRNEIKDRVERRKAN